MTTTTGPKGSRNDVTGDKLQSKPASDEYRANYARIFCKHVYEYKQSEHFDWYECIKCGHQKNKEYVP